MGNCTSQSSLDLELVEVDAPVPGVISIIKLSKNNLDLFHHGLANSCYRKKDIWEADAGGRTPLHWAVNAENSKLGLECARTLINYIPDAAEQKEYVCLQDAQGRTALHWAASKGNLDMVTCLLSYGADPLLRDKNDESALHAVAKYAGNPEHTVTIGSLLMVAAKGRGKELLDFLSKEDRQSALVCAVETGNVPMVQYLLDQAATLCWVLRNSSSVLHFAIQHENTKVAVELTKIILTAAPSQVNNLPDYLGLQDDWGRTALHLAARDGNFTVLDWLVEAGADVSQVDKKNNTALHLAASLGSDEMSWRCVEQLLKRNHEMSAEDRKLFVNQTNTKGETALYLAGKSKNLNATRKLLLAGSEYDIRSTSNKTPLEQVYRNVPEAVLVALDQAVKRSNYSKRPGVIASYAKLDFAPILGQSSDPSKQFRETDEIAKINHVKKLEHRKPLLSHTFVKIFIWKKWQKIWWLFFLSRFFHILGYALCIWFMLKTFRQDCPFTGSQNSTMRFVMASVSPPEEDVYVPMTTLTECNFNGYTITGAVLMILFSGFIFLAEIYPAYQRFEWHYKPSKPGSSIFKKLFKFAKLLFLTLPVAHVVVFVFILHTVLPIFGEFPEDEMMHSLYAGISCFTACVCIFLEIGKIPLCRVYINLLLKIAKSILFASLVVVVLLIGFAVLFIFLFPGVPSYSSLPQAIFKVLTLSIGELDYQDTIYEQNFVVMKGVAMLAYGIFVLFVVLVLVNFLIGLAMDDIKEYRKMGSEIWKLCTQIDQIMLLESFMDSCFGRCLGGQYILTEYLMLMPPFVEGELRLTAEIFIPELPKDLQKELHELLNLKRIPANVV